MNSARFDPIKLLNIVFLYGIIYDNKLEQCVLGFFKMKEGGCMGPLPRSRKHGYFAPLKDKIVFHIGRNFSRLLGSMPLRR